MEIIKNTTIELPVIIAGVYGLRREEVIGIKWNAIDFKAKTLTIRHTVGVVKLMVSHNLFSKIELKAIRVI
mgnify:CR=1 FL=1